MEKYESGVLHPSEVFNLYDSLDIYDKEKFIDMLLEDEKSMAIVNSLLYYDGTEDIEEIE